MKTYEPYIFDEAEAILSEAHKELAVDGVYKPEVTREQIIKNKEQCDVLSGCFYASVNLLQIYNLELGIGGGIVQCSLILSQLDKQQTLIVSPDLSREKLLALNNKELSDVLISLILDRDNWDKTPKYSTILSDGNGNWI